MTTMTTIIVKEENKDDYDGDKGEEKGNDKGDDSDKGDNWDNDNDDDDDDNDDIENDNDHDKVEGKYEVADGPDAIRQWFLQGLSKTNEVRRMV